MEQEIKQDKILICNDCGQEFTFEVGEQEWFAAKKFETPKRCKACRDKRKKQKREQQSQSEHFVSGPPKTSWKSERKNRNDREGVYDGEKIQRY